MNIPDEPTMNETIFVKNSGERWSVFSSDWEVPAVDEKTAFSIKKLIEKAYDAGGEDVREDLYDLITPKRLLP